MSSGQNHSLFLQVAQWSQVWIFCIVNEEAEEEADDDDDEDKDEHEDDEDDDLWSMIDTELFRIHILPLLTILF